VVGRTSRIIAGLFKLCSGHFGDYLRAKRLRFQQVVQDRVLTGQRLDLDGRSLSSAEECVN